MKPGEKITYNGVELTLISYPDFSCTFCYFRDEFKTCPRKKSGALKCEGGNIFKEIKP